MANNVHRYGVRFYKSGTGSGIPSPDEYVIASSYTANVGGADVDMNIGDPVELLADGTVRLAADGAVDPGQFLGVIVGFSNVKDPVFTGTGRPSSFLTRGTTWATKATQSRALVIPFSNHIWEMDVSANGTSSDTETEYLATIGNAFPLTYSADTTNADRPKANPLLDFTTVTNTASDHFMVWGISKTMFNVDFTGNFVKMLVKLNEGIEPYLRVKGDGAGI